MVEERVSVLAVLQDRFTGPMRGLTRETQLFERGVSRLNRVLTGALAALAGFLALRRVVDFFQDYADSFDAPVREFTNVRRVGPCGDLFVTETDDGPFLSRNVVIATGWCDQDAVPATAVSVSTRVNQVVPSRYKRPDDLPAGGVLVVGASATGVQLAQELHLSGRPVTLAVGSHSRMPRTYRGMDSCRSFAFREGDQTGRADAKGRYLSEKVPAPLFGDASVGEKDRENVFHQLPAPDEMDRR